MQLSFLVAEDDADVRSLLVEALTDVGCFTVLAVETAAAAQALMVDHGDSLATAVLDVGLPDGDGRDLCASLRRQGFHLPVTLLSSQGEEDDIVRGFEAEADDYLIEPFGVAELLARVAAQLRRTMPQARPMPACLEAATGAASPEAGEVPYGRHLEANVKDLPSSTECKAALSDGGTQ